MSKPIDQERADFEAWFAREIEPSVSYGNPDILRRSYWTAWQARAAVQPAGVAVPSFAAKIIKKLERVHACFTDAQDADIGKDWFDILTKLGLLDRIQRSPAVWQISDAGDALLDSLASAPHPVSGEQRDT